MIVFPEEKLARMNGILQSFTGLGMLVGPIIGSLLFRLGGFQLPFYVVGVLLLMLAVVNYRTIPGGLQQEFESETSSLLDEANKNNSINNDNDDLSNIVVPLQEISTSKPPRSNRSSIYNGRDQ